MESNKALELLRNELHLLMTTPTGRRTFLTGLPLLLASCATGQKSRYREGDNTGQKTSLTVADERRMAQEYLPQMAKEYPTHRNAKAQRYIASLGNDIVQANGLAGNPYHYTFAVVDAKMVNAFALPAGTVFVTAPLIKMARSEAELAGVIGHEIGHVKARHTAERIETAKKEKNKGILFGLGGAILGGAAGYGLGKVLCQKQERECMRRAMTYGAAAGAGGGLLIQKFAFMANGREDEMEADRIGFKTSLQTGYHKDYIGRFYNRLLVMEQKHKGKKNGIMAAFADAMSTHPPSQKRVNQMNHMAGSFSNVGTKITSESFKRIQKLL